MSRAEGARPTRDSVARLDDVSVEPGQSGAYQWWYFDGLSDDGAFGFVAIFFVGGVFSPLYADRLAAGVKADPFDHCMVNFALYARGRRIAWVFSEYPREAVLIGRNGPELGIGASELSRQAEGYAICIDDEDFPARAPVRAHISFRPEAPGLGPPGQRLSTEGRHRWAAPAPRCRFELESETAGVRCAGWGYHDVNEGDEPLHAGWNEWWWGRAELNGAMHILYDATTRQGERRSMLLIADDSGGRTLLAQPTIPRRALSAWLLRPPAPPKIDGVEVRPGRMMEASPFYLRRSATFLRGAAAATGMCEYLDLQRFANPAVRSMLRYRTFRRSSLGGNPFPAQVHRKHVFPDDQR